MKNKIFKWIALSAIVALTIACNPKKEDTTTESASVDKEQIKGEIQALENSFADALNTGKTENVNYYAEDAVSYEQNKPPMIGKAAIDAKIAEDVKKNDGTKVTFITNEVFPSGDGNIVVEIGSYKVSDSSNDAKYSGNFIAYFEKRDGKYVCVRDMGASDQPTEEKK
ncbi:YybH family protein [Flavobacterium sp.]|jgi:ketosteroid isomerase-like protein|uniref:YybH family protein n=1 Tax=Flavobacterium sp. TaxID=239 RepID=UPI0037BE7996